MIDENYYVSINKKNVLLSLHSNGMLIVIIDLEFAQTMKRWL